MLTTVLETVATAAAGLFAGAALYITVVSHPARQEATPAAAVAEFRATFPRAAPMQAGLALTSFTAGVLAALRGAGWPWAVGAVTIGAVVPFTLLVMQEATNRELLEADLVGADAVRLLGRWGRLHALRTGLGLIGFLVFLLA